MKAKTFFFDLSSLRFLLYLVVFHGILISLASCSDDEEGPDCSLQGTNLSISDISGNWTATSARFSPLADGPAVEVDVVADGGTVTLSIQGNGGFTLTIREEGGTADVSPGDFCFDEDLLVVRFDEDAPDDYEFYSIQLSPGNNELTISGPAEFDIDGNGTDEAALVILELTRS